MANVEAIIEDKGLKFLFVGGKGGVGKTTCSSAIACQLAYERKILLISTDPAHSLGDAFRIKFSGEPTAIPGVPNLEVMEVNPETNLQEEIKHWAEMARKAGMDEMLEKVSEFQEWLSGVPGIDEATALTSVIGHIESGTYDLIVFDTAPTGHTLKLLQLPKILQAGLDKLQSWQAKMWDVWQLMKGAVSTGPEMSPAEMKRAIADKLQEYKDGMEKISVILKDTSATNFMIVCIAEYLSINESQRLLSELQRNNIRVTHIVVNQLVKGWVSDAEMPAFDALLSRADPRPEEDTLLQKIQASIELTNARGGIQAKYLADLQAFPEVSSAGVAVVELPLLAGEVTGPEAILSFSQKMVSSGYRSAGPAQLQGWTPTAWSTGAKPSPPAATAASATTGTAPTSSATEDGGFQLNDRVMISGLAGSKQYNGYTGKVVELNEGERIGVEIIFKAARKRLSLKKANLSPVSDEPAAKRPAPAPAASPIATMLAGLEADPDVQEALKNPKVASAYEEVKANPMSFMKYMGDPDIAPLVQKVMAKMSAGGGNPMAGLLGAMGGTAPK